MACYSPFYVEVKGRLDKVPAPCGRCPYCKRRRVNTWAFRLMQEERVSTSSYFVTLTYNTKTIPITPSGRMTLRKTDFQKFMKRLRKLQDKTHKNFKLRYYACGEYGEHKWRPHYHMILFNLADIENINKAWNLGDVHIGEVNEKTTAYCAKYIDKEKRIPQYKGDDRLKEFSLMSKGLGKSYLSKARIKYHKANLNQCYVTSFGFKIAMPRYYRDKIFTDVEKSRQTKIIQKQLLQERTQKARLIAKKYKGRYTLEEYERLQQFGDDAAFNSPYKQKRND